MKPLKKILTGSFFFVFTLSWSIQLTALLSPYLFKGLIGPLKLSEVTSFTKEVLFEAYSYIVHYLLMPSSGHFEIPHFSSSPEGIIHFQDVKILFFFNGIVCLLGILFFVFFKRKGKRAWLKVELKHLFNVLIIAPLFLLFSFLIAFEPLFILFHKLLFSNDYWMFNPAMDPIIKILPQEFFLVLFVGVILVYEGLILIQKRLLK